jgi:hypothetical protein
MGDGSVRVQFGARVVATKNLSWRTEIRTRPALPVVKFPSALKPPQLNALRARIAKTPGGLPVASPGGKASCRMLAAWWGYPSDAFPYAPRLRYSVPPQSWLAVACTPVSNAAGSAAVAPANGAAAKGIAWGAFTPYNPPPAPIPAFELTFPVSAIPGATGAQGRSSFAIKRKGFKARVEGKGVTAETPPKVSVTEAFFDEGDPGTVRVKLAAMPVDMEAGSARIVLDYDYETLKVSDLASADKTWEPTRGDVAPRMPEVTLPLPEKPAAAAPPVIEPAAGNIKAPWISSTGLAAIRPAEAPAAGGAAAGTTAPAALGGCSVKNYREKVSWVDRPASPAIDASCSTPWLMHGGMVAVGAVVLASGSRGDDGGTRIADAPEVTVPRVNIEPPAPPNDNLGDPSWWRFTLPQFWNEPNGQPVRWPAPTAPINVFVNCPALPAPACDDEAGRVAAAVVKVREGGGPNLRYAGIDKSTFVPTKARHTDPAKQGAITFTFTKAAATAGGGATDIFNGLGNTEAGVGGFDWINRNDGKGASIAAGYVAIDSTKLPAVERNGAETWRLQVLYMHELGHAIGLTHPDVARTLPNGTQQPALPSKGQIMDSTLDVPAPRWGNGDLKGLKLVGSEATPPAPEPRPTLAMGTFSGVGKTSLIVGLTVTTVKSAAVCLAYGRADQAPDTWAMVPIEVVGPVAGMPLSKHVTGLTRSTKYGFRAKLMPTSDCNGSSSLLPFTPITTRTTSA